MNLYFGNLLSIISTLLVIGIFIYIGVTVEKQNEIKSFGRRIAILALWGLLICIFVATRDGYVLSVQASIDTGVLPGLFTVDSIQSTLCSLGGAVIAFCSLSSIFVILAATILLKTLVIEISRVLL